MEITPDSLKTSFPELRPWLQHCEFLDVKSAEGTVSLREFVHSMATWNPWWVKLLYGIRTLLAPLFSIRKVGIPMVKDRSPDMVPFDFGASYLIGEVVIGDEERIWAVEAADNHLTALLAVTAEPLEGGRKRFSIVTIVRFFKPAGRFYLALIKPFHDLIVKKMLASGVS